MNLTVNYLYKVIVIINIIICFIYLSLLGKFGGVNRSSLMKTNHLKAQEQFNQVSRKHKICITFDVYNNSIFEIDIGPVSKT